VIGLLKALEPPTPEELERIEEERSKLPDYGTFEF
jgi:hypothetical protein